MNIRKTLLTTTLFFAGTATALLADNGKAIEFYKTGRIEPAKAMLLQNLATGAGDKAEAAYYLGEIYKDANQLDSAAYYYGVGKAADRSRLPTRWELPYRRTSISARTCGNTVKQPPR